MIALCLNCNKDYDQDTQGAICPHESGERRRDSLPTFPKRSEQEEVNSAVHYAAMGGYGQTLRAYHQRLSADLTAAQERIQMLERAIDGAEHTPSCSFREWECSQPTCGETHTNPCNCFKAVLAPKETTDGR